MTMTEKESGPQPQPRTRRSKFQPVIIATIILAVVAAVGLHFFIMPMFMNPPQVVQTIPPDGATSVNPRDSILIEFDQWIQPDTVARAVQIEPPANLTVESQQRTTIALRPEGGLEHGTTYRLTLGAGVANIAGNYTKEPLTLTFTTVPYVGVTRVSPERGADGISLNTPLIVEFDTTVVATDTVEASADDPELAATLPQPLALEAERVGSVEGVGRWITPSQFSFFPEGGLRNATTYTATMQRDLFSDGQARLEQPVAWTFTTASVLRVEPRPHDGASDVSPGGPVEVRLTPDIDVAAAGGYFGLYRVEGDGPVEGHVTTSGESLLFHPDAPLRHATTYEARLLPGIPSTTGNPVTTQPLAWRFTTMGDLAVEQVEPPPTTPEVSLDTRRISVRFNHPVVALTTVEAQESLPHPLTITPALEGEGHWLDTRTYVYSPTEMLLPGTTYQVRVDSGLEDQDGSTLPEDYTWRFTTTTPRVVRSTPEDGADLVSPVEPLHVDFTMPMAEDSLQAALSLQNTTTGETVPATVSLSEGDPEEATLTPTAPLERGTSYALTVSPGARALRGLAETEQEYQATFRVAPLPRLVSSSPANGEQDVDSSRTIELTFSAPMEWGTVFRHLTIEPEATIVQTSTHRTGAYIYAQLEPETSYRLTVGTQARDVYGVALQEEAATSFRTGPLPPSLSLVGANRIGGYHTHTPTRVPMRHVNIPEVAYRLYRLTPEQTMELLTSYDAWRTFQSEPSMLVASDTIALGGERNQQAMAMLELGQLEAGLYYLTVHDTSPQTTDTGLHSDRQIMAVSPYALTVKRSAEQLFVWAVDLDTGQPVENLPLTVAYSPEDGEGFESRDLGQSDREGVWQEDLSEGSVYAPLFLWSPPDPEDPEGGESRFAFATTNWDDGIGPWSFGLPVEYERTPFVGTLFTDRPIYRPGHLVSIRGAVRTTEGETYHLPDPEQEVYLRVSDPQGNELLENTLPLSEFGTFHTSLTLDGGARPGSYSMAVLEMSEGMPGREMAYGSFLVAEYRKPAFEVSVTPEQTDYVQDETMEFDVSASYYAGGAVANAPIHWRLLSRPYTFQSETAPQFSFDNPDDAYAWYRGDEQRSGGELVSEGTATTDGQGTFHLSLPARLEDALESQQLTLDVEVTDVDEQVIASRATVTVHAGMFYVGQRPEGYVARAGQPQEVSLLTLDVHEQPVSNREVQVTVYKREWYTVRERGDNGRMYWTSTYSETEVDRPSATTDEQGRGSITFTPSEGGSYRIQAETQDDEGHTIRSSVFTWAYGGDVFWGIDNTNRIDLIADQSRYRPGETASILVTAPYEGMTALVTLERAGVVEHRLMNLSDTSELLEVDITADHAPNIYVSVVLVKPTLEELPVPDVRVGIINLPVSTEQQELTIAITPDQEDTAPREDVTYTIRATDHAGNGVRTELSLALVDKAVLALADDPNPTLTQAFYEKRPLGVRTSQTIIGLVDRVTLHLEPGEKGGGGGMAEEVLARRDFPDTAYWNPALVTDDQGNAKVTLTLPDSLTTWRLTARGLTRDTLVGQETSDVVATLPLFVRPSLPRFLTAGDLPTLQAVVHNTTPSAIETDVTLEVAGLHLDTPAQQTVEVPANGQVVVRWQAEVPAPGQTDGQATLRFSAVGGGLSDAVEQVLPVQRFLTPEVVASAGQVRDAPVVETLSFTVPETRTAEPGSSDRPPDPGEMSLELVPSLAAGVESGLDYLEHYPYGCTEQTVSRFLPNAVTYRLFRDLGMEHQDLKAALERNLSEGLQRLSHLQNLDGGWGWWASESSHPYLTAYVVQGLLEVQRAGYGVDQQVLDRALTYLEEVLDGVRPLSPEEAGETGRTVSFDDLSRNTRAYVLFVMSEADRPDRGRTIALYEQREALGIYGRAYLLMTLDNLGQEEERVRTLIGDLMGRAILRTTTAHWEEHETHYWTMSSDDRSTALALQALVRTDPDNFLVPNAVRHLMQRREDGHWRSTQETAITLMALAEYLAQSGELEASYTYQATLDGQTIKQGSVNRENLDEPVTVVVALAEMIADQQPAGDQQHTSSLTLQKEGPGRLHYSLRLRSYQDASEVEPLDRGMAVQRDYIAVDQDTLEPTGALISEAQASEVVQVRVTLTVPDHVSYLVVEDMLPAGLEPLDTSLKTVSDAMQEGELAEEREEEDEDEVFPSWRYFAQTEIHDNRVALFATYLTAGTYHYTYLARATTAGTFQTLPTLAYQMYAPEVFGRSSGTRFVVR